MTLQETDWKKFFFDEGLEVQGTGALRRTENGVTKEVKPQVGNNGRKYIYVNDRKTTVDYLVASCFCHKEPGQKYIRHKDGDITNDNFKNLEWTDVDPTLNQPRFNTKSQSTQYFTKVNNGESFQHYLEDKPINKTYTYEQ